MRIAVNDVDSSVIDSFKYDTSTSELSVIFNSGVEYIFVNVKHVDVLQMLVPTVSVGSAFTKYIKSAYDYKSRTVPVKTKKMIEVQEKQERAQRKKERKKNA